MIKFTRIKDKVIIDDGKNIYALSTECNILPHPRNDDYIIISEVASPQYENFAILIRWNDTNIPVQSRKQLIEILAKYYFSAYKIDDTRFLDTVGDGTGNKQFTGDYSSNPVKAIIKPINDSILYINRLIIFIADSGSVDAGYYGNSISLNNGIFIKHEKQDGTLIKDITDGMPIKTNADYARYGFQVSDISFGSGLNYIHAVLTFEKNGTPLTLQPDEQLSIYLNDDFSPLKQHTFRAGAYYL